MSMLSLVERHIRKNRVSPARIGRESVGDPRLVFDMRNGRNLGGKIEARLQAYLSQQEGGAA